MGLSRRTTWHLAGPQRLPVVGGLEPVGPDRDHGTGVSRRTRGAGRALSEYRGGLVLSAPALGRTSIALSQRLGRLGLLACNVADPLIHPAARVS